MRSFVVALASLLVVASCSSQSTPAIAPTNPPPEQVDEPPTQPPSGTADRHDRSDDTGLAHRPVLSSETDRFALHRSDTGAGHIIEEFTEPTRWPDHPPDGAEPVEIALFVGTVLTNFTPTQPFDPTLITDYLTDALAAEFNATRSGHIPGSFHRAVVVDQWTDQDAATLTRVDAVTVFERSVSLHNESTQSGFEFVYVDTSFIRDPERGWVIAELQLTTR